ncbi:MAG TPA: MFS transporter, partial [Nitrososphaerales archaeon]|nr:MFS transporter [Nitrososphaerales archaeon]
AYGLVETAEYTMFMFGTPLGSALAGAFGNQLTFFITGAVLAAGAFAGYVGMPDVHSMKKTPAPDKSPGPLSQPNGPFRLMYEAVSDRKVQTSLLAIFFVSIGFTVFRVYLTQYGAAGPFIVAIMAAASVFAAVPIGRLLDTTKRRSTFMAVGFLVEGLALAFIFYEPNDLTVIVWALVFGVAVMLVRVPQAVVIAERTIVENRASAMGANHGVEHIGYGVGAFLGGLLLVYFGFSTLDTFWLVALISAAFGLALIPLARSLKLA